MSRQTTFIVIPVFLLTRSTVILFPLFPNCTMFLRLCPWHARQLLLRQHRFHLQGKQLSSPQILPFANILFYRLLSLQLNIFILLDRDRQCVSFSFPLPVLSLADHFLAILAFSFLFS